MSNLYRLVYTSRNLLEGSDSARAATVAEILATSQRNNSKVGVTGALLFNAGLFAQVLEGPKKAVEATFERIQRDPRHGDVSVLQCESVESRGFQNWSMAFIGHSARGRAIWQEMAAQTGFDLSRIEGEKLFASLHAIMLDEEDVSADLVSGSGVEAMPPPAAATAVPSIGPLDINRLRKELLQRPVVPGFAPASTPTSSATPSAAAHGLGKPPQEIESVVLRAALVEERERTTALRRTLDEIRIALAAAHDEVETLRRHRTIWAERAKTLASALCRDLDPVEQGDPAASRAPEPALKAVS